MDKITLQFAPAISRIIEAGKLAVRGSTLIIEILPEVEVTTAGGIMLASSSKHVRGSVDEHRLKIGYVIAVGEGYVDDTGAVTPLDIQPGAIVFLPKYSISPISVFPGLNCLTEERVAMIKEDQVLAFYPSLNLFEAACVAGRGAL